jgi:hypothetical protein
MAMNRDLEIIESILFMHDPIGLNLTYNADEYRTEASAIMLRRPEAHTLEDVRRIVHEEFTRCFDSVIAGAAHRYDRVAEDIWWLWAPQGASTVPPLPGTAKSF